jgi:hypothetical protein
MGGRSEGTRADEVVVSRQMTERRAFFFPHALTPGREVMAPPGRVPFYVIADVVSLRSAQQASVTVYADGYGPNVVGSNQDPCVLAAPAPFHSFCRIDGRRADNHVRGMRKPLSQIVRPGDVIVYGKFEPKGGAGPTERIWVDLVLVVDSTPQWPTSTRARGERCRNPACDRPAKFTLSDPAAFAARLTGVSPGRGTAAYELNLRDGESSGAHCCTALGEYRVILGARDATPDALAALRTSFVPLADEAEGTTSPTFVTSSDLADHWSDLVAFVDGTVRLGSAGPRGGWIAQFPTFDLAKALCMAMVSRSGASQGHTAAVAIPPLQPAGPLRRWDPWRAQLVP